MPLLYSSFLGGGGGGSGGSWTPSDLGAALLAWYEADALAGADNSSVSSWTDSSGNGNTLTTVGGQEPKLRTAALDGKNVIEFNGSTQYFIVPNIFSGGTAGSAYLVVKTDADPAAASGSSGLWNFGTSASANHYPFTDGVIYDGFGSNARKTVGNPTPSLASWRIVSAHSGASHYSFYIDGVQIFTTATNTVAFNAGPNLGRSSTGIYLDGRKAEALFTNVVDSTTDRQKIEGYLAHKWGLAGNLDAGHPYKSSPP